jgi:hypothetical protein
MKLEITIRPEHEDELQELLEWATEQHRHYIRQRAVAIEIVDLELGAFFAGKAHGYEEVVSKIRQLQHRPRISRSDSTTGAAESEGE